MLSRSLSVSGRVSKAPARPTLFYVAALILVLFNWVWLDQSLFKYLHTNEAVNHFTTERHDDSVTANTRPYRRVKVLHGIFSADFEKEVAYRKRHRDLFALWNDSRVCVLYDFVRMEASSRDNCEFIYTFVMGANPDASTQLVSNEERPWLLDGPVNGTEAVDINRDVDILYLNIRENMEDGKSPSWFAYASTIARTYGLDYITKCDSDTIISLHEFFRFAYWHMPPSPYNSMVLQCIPFDKHHWPKNDVQDGYFNDHYNRVHNYCSGELYTLSTDLAVALTEHVKELNGTCPYCGGREDHDVSSMVFHTPYPIKFVMMSKRHVYWTHRVKSKAQPFQSIWSKEQARMTGQPWEGQTLSKRSTYHDIVMEHLSQTNVTVATAVSLD